MPKQTNTVKLILNGGGAKPGAQLAALSSKGIKAIDFCKAFNEETKDRQGKPLCVKIALYDDKTFRTTIKYTPTSQLVMEAANLEKGSSEPKRVRIGSITKEQLKEIALLKKKDGNAFKLEAAMKSIAGTAKSMGIAIA